MAQLVLAKRINASIEDVWASWDDFGNIARFSAGIAGSRLLTDESQPAQVGTTRHCDFADGKNWVREKIIDYRPMESIGLEVYDGTVPLKSMAATFDFEKISDSRTRVRMTVNFEPKFGILGKLMVPLIKKQFGKNLGELLDGNAAYVERGEPVQEAA